VQFNPIYTKSFNKTILMVETSDEILNKARQIKSQYDSSIKRLMVQHDIATEFEIWTGFALTKPRVGSGYKLQEQLGREIAMLKQRYQEVCYEVAGGMTFEKLRTFVAAMYKVTHEEVKIALYERRAPMSLPGRVFQPRRMDANSMPLISFPWIFTDHLCLLAKPGAAPTHLREFRKKLVERLQKPRAEQPDDAGAPAVEAIPFVTRLDDGRIIHRGEELNLFSSRDEDSQDDGIPVDTRDTSVDEEVDEAVEALVDEDNAADRLLRLMGD
jgi:RNA-dependent RNA polymerase